MSRGDRDFDGELGNRGEGQCRQGKGEVARKKGEDRKVPRNERAVDISGPHYPNKLGLAQKLARWPGSPMA
jgi:hypothetical protein